MPSCAPSSSSRQYFRCCRNLTITGLQGKDIVLNLEYKRALVELCRNCTLTFSNITISHERRGTGSVYDLFLGMPGSRIIADDIYKLRVACTSPRHLAQVTSRTKRSSILPGSSKPQDFEFVNVTFEVSAALQTFDGEYNSSVDGLGLVGLTSTPFLAVAVTGAIPCCQRRAAGEDFC